MHIDYEEIKKMHMINGETAFDKSLKTHPNWNVKIYQNRYKAQKIFTIKHFSTGFSILLSLWPIWWIKESIYNYIMYANESNTKIFLNIPKRKICLCRTDFLLSIVWTTTYISKLSDYKKVTIDNIANCKNDYRNVDSSIKSQYSTNSKEKSLIPRI